MAGDGRRGDRLRLGLVGPGQWARAAHLASLRRHPAAHVVALAARRPESAAELAAGLGATLHGSAEALLDDPAVEAVLVTAPAAAHRELVLGAVERGKPVLCEAPLAMTAAEGAALLAAARAAGCPHGYCLPRPFLYGGERLQELIAGGVVGRPESAQLTFRGNPWLYADPARVWRARADAVPPLLVGVAAGVLGELFGDVARVCAQLRRLAPSGGDGAVPPAHDYFAALFELADGPLVAVQAGGSPLPVPGSGLSVFGESGMLLWDWTTPGRILLGRAGADALEEVGVPPEPDLGRAFPYARRFVDAVLAGEPPRPGFESGARELSVIEACAASERSGEWVAVPPAA